VDPRSVDRIRKANFSHAVRGYDRHEVDQFLADLADWLDERGDDATSELVRAELERIGEQTSNILTEAHDAAQTIREEAEREVRQTLVDANLKSEALRSGADEYADETRQGADNYARKIRTEAATHSEQVRTDADEYAGQLRADADADAQKMRTEFEASVKEQRAAAEQEAERIVKEASRRRRDTEAVISDLEERRDAVLSELERLASGLAGTATQHRGSPRAGDQADGEDEAASAPRAAKSSE
jgi:DivIVA domain-containing protein